ncbi:MAG: hypothetical protein GY778_23725 [bacterium]|nr:hypothetical protein [bacterium]
MELRALDWVIIFGYLAITIGGALYLRRYVTGVATFLVAGRKVRKFLLTSTGSSTEVGIIAVVMMAQEAYVTGPVALSFPIIAVASLMLMGLTGFCVYRLRQTRAITLGHYFEMRYGSRGFRIFSGVPLMIAGISTIAMFPAVAGTFFTYFLDWPPEVAVAGMTLRTPALVAAVLLVVILGYTLVSGSVGLMFSDFMQFIVVWVALILTAVCISRDVAWSEIVGVFERKGGPNAFSTLRADSHGLAWIAFMVLQCIYGAIVWPPICTRVLSAKVPRVSKQMYVLTGLMQPGRIGMIMLMGLGAAVAISASDLPDPGEVLLSSPALAAMPMYVVRILPPLGIAILLAGLLAAHVGTVNSYSLAWSGVLTQDIVVPACKRDLPESAQVRINQLMIVVLGVAVYLWAVYFTLTETLLTYIMLSAATYSAGAAAVLTLGLYWRRANIIGAWSGMILGMILPIACMVSTGFLGLPFLAAKWVGIISYVLAFSGMVGGTFVGERFFAAHAVRPAGAGGDGNVAVPARAEA